MEECIMYKEKETFENICDKVEQELEKYGLLSKINETFKKNDLEICYSLNLSGMDIIGILDIRIQYLNDEKVFVFCLSKEDVPIYINNCESLKSIISIFFGSPFSLTIKKIEGLEFARYSVSVTECQVKDAATFNLYLKLLKECVTNLNSLVIYD